MAGCASSCRHVRRSALPADLQGQQRVVIRNSNRRDSCGKQFKNVHGIQSAPIRISRLRLYGSRRVRIEWRPKKQGDEISFEAGAKGALLRCVMILIRLHFILHEHERLKHLKMCFSRQNPMHLGSKPVLGFFGAEIPFLYLLLLLCVALTDIRL